MKRKIVSYLLIASTACTMFAGCGNNTTQNNINSSVEQEQNVSEEIPNEDVLNEDDSVEEGPSENKNEVDELLGENTDTETQDSIVENENLESENLESEIVEEDIVDEELLEEQDFTATQKKSMNMLNYMCVLTQQVNSSKNSRIGLENIQNSILNNIYPNAVDRKTQNQINNLWSTIDSYRMISVKRERLQYIYEQNKAQALRQAIPNPLGLLSAVQSGSMLKTAVSVLYMAADSAASYKSASTAADMEHLKAGWELEDEEQKAISDSKNDILNYMIEMTRENEIPGEYALSADAIKDFVKWSKEKNVVSKIVWFEDNMETYKEFRTYWLNLAQSYYYDHEYKKCMESVKKYEEVATRIFRQDFDYAKTIPLAIISAKEVMNKAEYVEYADKYAGIMFENCHKEDWSSRYFVAQIYIDLYANTKKEQYLKKAFDIAYNNVNVLCKEQRSFNQKYLKDIEEKKIEKGFTKQQKEDVKAYNRLLKEKRKTELPPINEAFYLNCDLLLALADKLEISRMQRREIDNIIHENGKPVLLSSVADRDLWAMKQKAIDSDKIKVEFDGKKLVLPTSCLTENSIVKVSVSGKKVFDDWKVQSVKRPKKQNNADFKVYLESKKASDYKYKKGQEIKITVIPVSSSPNKKIEFKYEVVQKKALGVIKENEIKRK